MCSRLRFESYINGYGLTLQLAKLVVNIVDGWMDRIVVTNQTEEQQTATSLTLIKRLHNFF